MTIPPTVRRESDALLAQYAIYKKLSSRQAALARELAKAKLTGTATQSLVKRHEHITADMQAVSDAMTFASPLVWALYKYEAYAHESQPVRTMNDFRLHCSKPGYICTARFTFVNKHLRARSLPTLVDTATYPDSQPLTAAFPVLHALSQDDVFMRQWQSHEYYKSGDRVAKWENI